MTGKPLKELNDPSLLVRAYNLGLKLVPNFVQAITVEELEYYEKNLGELKNISKEGIHVPLSHYLHLGSGGQELHLPATTGKRTIAKASNVFLGGIDPNFTNWGLDMESPPTPATEFKVYELVYNADFKTIFAGSKLRFTQDQVIAFAEHHAEWIPINAWETLLPFTVNDENFVARLCRGSDGRRYAHARRLADDNVWGVGFRARVVLPQLKT